MNGVCGRLQITSAFSFWQTDGRTVSTGMVNGGGILYTCAWCLASKPSWGVGHPIAWSLRRHLVGTWQTVRRPLHLASRGLPPKSFFSSSPSQYGLCFSRSLFLFPFRAESETGGKKEKQRLQIDSALSGRTDLRCMSKGQTKLWHWQVLASSSGM